MKAADVRDFEKLGVFYLGRVRDPDAGELADLEAEFDLIALGWLPCWAGPGGARAPAREDLAG